jgi:hypothetical protein
MRRPVRGLLGIVVLLATLGPSTSSSAQEPPPLPSSIAAIGDSVTQAFDVCCFYGDWPRHSWSTGYDPSPLGQATLAAETWRVSWWGS